MVYYAKFYDRKLTIFYCDKIFPQKTDHVLHKAKTLYALHHDILWKSVYLVLILGYIAYLTYACIYDFEVRLLSKCKQLEMSGKELNAGQHLIEWKIFTQKRDDIAITKSV